MRDLGLIQSRPSRAPREGLCVAWANFSGTTAEVHASYNVSSVSHDSQGQYTITWTRALPSSVYVVGGMTRFDGSASPCCVNVKSGTVPGTSSVIIQTKRIASGDVQDPQIVMIAAFGRV